MKKKPFRPQRGSGPNRGSDADSGSGSDFNDNSGSSGAAGSGGGPRGGYGRNAAGRNASGQGGRPAGRGSAGRASGGRPTGGRPSGERPTSGRPSGERSGGGYRGGYSSEGRGGASRGSGGPRTGPGGNRPAGGDRPRYPRDNFEEEPRDRRLPSSPPRFDARPLVVPPSASIPAVYVRARTLHPLLYRKRIDRVERAQPGDLVAVYDGDEQLSGYGIYNPRSEIAIRMLWHGPDLPSEEDWNERLRGAVGLRHGLLGIPRDSDAYRVLHAESDGMSGLVVDRFGDVLSAEVFSLGMYQRAQDILGRLAPLCGTKHTLIQPSPQFVSQEGCEPPALRSPELPSQVTIQEYGTRFRIRFDESHKTGFFCDQRENRKRLAEFCAGKDVLDICCYTGGFSVQAAKLGKAERVTGIDLDHHPLALARENANLNQARVKFVQADAFAFLRDMIQNGRQYDVVILDPPKLIRTRAEVEEGTRKHFALNQLAMQVVRPGGILLSCSCAGLLSEAEFVNLLAAAARRAGLSPGEAPEPGRPLGREMRIIGKTGAAPDHPVLGNCLETEYLKAVWMVLD
jgi:23S rRNA (cytosine1962-C5)-methyltransferase